MTGYPIAQNILSATIIASNCITVGAYATAFMDFEREKARKLYTRHPKLEYFIIYRNDETDKILTEYSAGLKQYIQPQE